MVDRPDQEFVQRLRTTVIAYLNAVDAWETAYRKFYRMPGQEPDGRSDMLAEQREYEAQRRALAELVPRARQLCLKHGLRDPFANLLRVTLGGDIPRQQTVSVISRNERNAVADCLLQLADACGIWTPEGHAAARYVDETPPLPHRLRRNIAIAGGVFCALLAVGITLVVRRAGTARDLPAAPVPVRPLNRYPQTASAHFYRIGGRPLTRWGDYGDILQHGMTAHLERVEGRLQLERAGPYMPPITFPGLGDIVLTSAGRTLLESSGLTGFTFRPVIKTRIVDLPWQQWDLTSDKPAEYPRSGEPEDYILGRRADARIAEQMGGIWELAIPVTARIGRTPDLYLERNSWDGADVFRGDGYGSPLVTERARAWLTQHLGAYVEFKEFSSR